MVVSVRKSTNNNNNKKKNQSREESLFSFQELAASSFCQAVCAPVFFIRRAALPTAVKKNKNIVN